MTPASHPVSKPASMGLRCQPPQDTPRIFEDWLIALESVNVPHRQILKREMGLGRCAKLVKEKTGKREVARPPSHQVLPLCASVQGLKKQCLPHVFSDPKLRPAGLLL